MGYKPEPPPDKANFAGTQGFAGVPSPSKNTGYSGYVGYKSVVNQIGDEPIIAVLIESTVLGSRIWFSFAADFVPRDGVPVFYADELCLLKGRPVSTLRKIYETKKAFGPATRGAPLAEAER